MKKLLAVLCASIVTLLGTTTFSAKNVLDISLSCDEALKNRLFEVSVAEDSKSYICAGEMVLFFDESIVEFKEVKSEAFDVEAKKNGDSVHIVFAKSHSLAPGGELLKVVFKSIDYGSFDLDVRCSECVDTNLNKLNADYESASIEVNKKGVILRTKDSSKNKSLKSLYSNESGSIENIASSTLDYMDIDGQRKNYVIVLSALGFCVIIAIAFYFGMLFHKKTAESDLSEDENDDEIDDKSLNE